METVKSSFVTPAIEDQGSKRTAEIIIFIASTFTVVGGITALLNIFVNPIKWPGAVSLVFLLGVLLGCLALLHREKVRLAGILFSSFQWIMISALVTLSGGESSPLFPLIIISFLIPGLILGWRAGAIFTVLSAAITAGWLYAANAGAQPSSIIDFTMTTKAIADIAVIVLTSVTILYTVYTIQDDLRKLRVFTKALTESRMRLKTVVSNAPIVLFSIDKDGIFTLSEGKGLADLGLAPGEAVGKSAYEMYQDVPQIQKGLKRALGGDEFTSTVEVDDLVFMTSYSPLEDENGVVTGLIGVSTDITEQKKAEKEIESLSKFPTENPSPVMRISKDCTVLFANKASQPLLETWGYEIGKPLAGECAHMIQEALSSNTSSQSDMYVNGQVFNMIIYPIEGTDYVNIYGIDVTERRLAEERTREQYRRISALRRIDEAITSTFDRKVILDVVLDQVTSQLKVDAADVLLINPGTQELEYAAYRGFQSNMFDEYQVSLNNTLAGKAVQDRRVVSKTNLSDVYTESFILPEFEDDDFKSYFAAPLITKGNVVGVLEVFHRETLKPENDWLDFFETLAGQAAIAIDNANLFEDLQRSNIDLRLAYDATLEGWAQALDLRDRETENHTRRVTEMTVRLASSLGVSDSELVHLRRGALLHDIGKMGIPDSILQKPGALTDEEWAVMKQHPQYAYNFLSSIAYLRPALAIPYSHHEKWDGTGYPQGLKGEQIPFAARIFAVVDVWDALISDRPYRKAWDEEKTLKYIREQSGKHFDPEVVDEFMNMMKHQ